MSMRLINQSGKNMTERETLNQEQWSEFWRKMREYKRQVPGIECYINGKKRKFTEEEFEVARHLLWPPQEISKCCYAEIRDERCVDCGELCEKIYVF